MWIGGGRKVCYAFRYILKREGIAANFNLGSNRCTPRFDKYVAPRFDNCMGICTSKSWTVVRTPAPRSPILSRPAASFGPCAYICCLIYLSPGRHLRPLSDPVSFSKIHIYTYAFGKYFSETRALGRPTRIF